MRVGKRTVTKATLLGLGLACLAACDGREESALDSLANGANAAAVERDVKAEAQAVMEPLAPPPPGTPGGLPVDAMPVPENAVDPESAQGAAQVVQGYYSLLEQRRYSDAQDLWRDDSEIGKESDERFAVRFRGFLEVHALVGAPGPAEGAAGSVYVTVPVQVYGRLALNGKPWYALRQVRLRRVNDVDGAPEADRRWHIDAIGPFAPAEQAETASLESARISATDGIARGR